MMTQEEFELRLEYFFPELFKVVSRNTCIKTIPDPDAICSRWVDMDHLMKITNFHNSEFYKNHTEYKKMTHKTMYFMLFDYISNNKDKHAFWLL